MKFLCERCDKAMQYKKNLEGPEEPFKVQFECPGCGWRIHFISNPGEDQFVRSMGIRIGRKEGELSPLETLRSQLGVKDSRTIEAKTLGPTWTEEAEARLNLAPEFIREVARKATESFARQYGFDRITIEVIEAAQASMGKGIDQ